MGNISKSKLPNLTTNDVIYEYIIIDNEVTIVKYIGTETNIIIPETIEEYPVTTIGDAVFMNNIELESIALSSVSYIQFYAFAGCTSLQSVTGDKVTTINSYGFYKCEALKDITISNVQYLGQGSFSNCSNLETINLPLIQELPSNIFSKCYKLKTINIPNVKNIGAFAFENCEALEAVNSIEAVYIDHDAFCYSGIKEADFPKVNEVNYEAFLNCSFLQRVNLPLAASIGGYAFKSTLAKCITLSKKLTQIGTEIFEDSPVKGLTIDYGNEDISFVAEEDWYTFANKVTGLNVESVAGRYIKNNLYCVSFSVGDTEPPVIELNGDNPMSLEVGLSTYNEPGAIIKDNSCEIIKPVISGFVNTNKIGKYTITYTATDLSGNQAKAERIVNVIDTTAPVITLYGDSFVNVVVNTDYEEEGALVTDNSGENIVPILKGFVDDEMVGEYKVTYNAIDSSGNQAIPVVRTVNVVEDNNVRCSQIVAANSRGVIAKWALYSLEDVLLYESDNCLAEEQLILNLDSLSLMEGTEFYLKAIVEGSDGKSPVNLRYIPSSFTTYFVLEVGEGQEPTSNVHYSGMVDSDGTPPVIKSTKIKCANDAYVMLWWNLLTLDNKLIYKSEFILQATRPITIDFKELNMEAGTIIKVEADVMAGNKSSPYLYFQYRPEYNAEVTMSIIGSAFKTCVIVTDL